MKDIYMKCIIRVIFQKGENVRRFLAQYSGNLDRHSVEFRQ